MAQRLRQAVKSGTQVSFIDSVGDDPFFGRIHARMLATPEALPTSIHEVNQAFGDATQSQDADALTPAQKIAQSLQSGENVAVLLGDMAMTAPNAAAIVVAAQALAQAADAKFGILTEGGNTVGGYLAGAVPANNGLTAAQMLAEPLQAYLVHM